MGLIASTSTRPEPVVGLRIKPDLPDPILMDIRAQVTDAY
jgi:hypothetical protein